MSTARRSRVACRLLSVSDAALTDIYLELYRANGTEAMSSDMRNTIMPGMMDMGRKLADQLGKDPESIAEQIVCPLCVYAEQ
mgnify:CR=1 FL=1